MEWLYTTKQFDTFDVLAFDFYGDEHLAHVLMEANPDLLDYIFFPAGLTFVVPETPATATRQPAPPWAEAVSG